VTTPSGPPPNAEAQSERPGQGNADETKAHKPGPLQLDLPAASAKPAGQTATERGGSRAPRYMRVLASALGVLVLIAALAAAVAEWMLPWYVRRECIEVAAAHGIDLSVDDANISPDGFRLVGIRARSADVPGVRAQASEVEVETSGLRPNKVTVRGAELTLSGRWSVVDSDFEKWRESPAGGQAGAWAPTSLAIEGARVVWLAPIGENVRVEAADVHAEVTWSDHGADATSSSFDHAAARAEGTSQGADRAGGRADGANAAPTGRGQYPQLYARSDHVTVAVPGGTLGPWRMDIDRAPLGSRMRVALDPGVPEACTVLVVGGQERITSVDVVIPRSPLAHLGVPEKLLGLNGEGLQLDAAIHYSALGPTRADARANGSVHGIQAPGLPLPIDIAWEGTLSGDATAGIDVKKARLAVGPLVGPLSGTLKRFDDGFRVDLAWAAGPVPCAGFAAALGLGQPFDIGYELRKLGGAAHPPLRAGAVNAWPGDVTKVKGDVRATVMISFDSRDLGATKVDFNPEIGCQGLQ
jgi:hypothetical protein